MSSIIVKLATDERRIELSSASYEGSYRQIARTFALPIDAIELRFLVRIRRLQLSSRSDAVANDADNAALLFSTHRTRKAAIA